ACLSHGIDSARALVNDEVDGLGDGGGIVFAAEEHVATDERAANIWPRAHAAHEILDGTARLAGRFSAQEKNRKRGRLGDTGEIIDVRNLQPDVARVVAQGAGDA